jgi:hypothetical protein
MAVLTPSTPLAYAQVVSRSFAFFRVPRSDISAAQRDFCAGFDSRQAPPEKGRIDAALSRVCSTLDFGQRFPA